MRNRLFFAVLASTTLLLTDLPSHSYDAGGGDDNGNSDTVAIGDDAETKDDNAVAVGNNAVSDLDSVAIGNHAVSDVNAVAIGSAARADYQNSTAIGADSATTRSNQIAIGSKTSELTISNLEGTDTGVTYVEEDGTLRRSSVTTNMLEGFDGRINKLGDGVQGQIDDNRTAINSNRNNINSLVKELRHQRH